jgi:hypothetical protein
MGYAWVVKKVEYVPDIWSGRFPPEDKPILEERIAEARAAGLSVTIASWPKVPRSPDSVEVRMMGPPLDGDAGSS